MDAGEHNWKYAAQQRLRPVLSKQGKHMTPLMLTLTVFAHLLLAAHALRRGDWGLCLSLAALPLAR